jgi:hypothetical protein
MPAAGKIKTLDNTHTELEAMLSSRLPSSVGPKATDLLGSTKEVIDSMRRGVSPIMATMTTPTMQAVAQQLQFYCTFVVKKGEGVVADTILVGAAAAKAKLVALQKLSTEKALSLSDVDSIHSYTWLLSSEEQLQLRGLTKKIVTSICSLEVPSKKKAKSSTTTSSATTTDIMSLFS